MAHLFNSTDYCDYRSKSYNNIKKTLENKIDLLAETTHTQLHPLDLQEDFVIDGANFTFTHQGESFILPRKILEVKELSSIINMDVIQNEF